MVLGHHKPPEQLFWNRTGELNAVPYFDTIQVVLVLWLISVYQNTNYK